jgi:hypothetical protein
MLLDLVSLLSSVLFSFLRGLLCFFRGFRDVCVLECFSKLVQGFRDLLSSSPSSLFILSESNLIFVTYLTSRASILWNLIQRPDLLLVLPLQTSLVGTDVDDVRVFSPCFDESTCLSSLFFEW